MYCVRGLFFCQLMRNAECRSLVLMKPIPAAKSRKRCISDWMFADVLITVE